MKKLLLFSCLLSIFATCKPMDSHEAKIRAEVEAEIRKDQVYRDVTKQSWLTLTAEIGNGKVTASDLVSYPKDAFNKQDITDHPRTFFQMLIHRICINSPSQEYRNNIIAVLVELIKADTIDHNEKLAVNALTPCATKQRTRYKNKTTLSKRIKTS